MRVLFAALLLIVIVVVACTTSQGPTGQVREKSTHRAVESRLFLRRAQLLCSKAMDREATAGVGGASIFRPDSKLGDALRFGI